MYPTVRLAEVLTQNTEYIDNPEPRIYPKLSVKLYGKGVVLDEPADGATLRMQRHQLAKAGQVILSEIWGKKGAIGFVPLDGEGALCTSHFFLFDVQTDPVLPQYLHYIFISNYLEPQLNKEAKGTTGYAAVRPKHLLAAEIPLPPLDEQRRIVAHIDALAEQIAAARGLRHGAVDEAIRLLRAILFFPSDWQPVPTPMSELVKQRSLNVQVEQEVTYRFAGVYSFGRGVFAGSVKNGSEFKYTQLATLHTNNFIYPKLMAWEGAFGVVPPECDGLVVSPEFPVFEIDQTRVLPEVLDVYFKTPLVWPAMAALSTGTNVRRRRLHPNAFLSYQFPLPPMDVQLELRAAKSELERVVRLHNDVVAELDALLPSLLDQAFRGEL